MKSPKIDQNLAGYTEFLVHGHVRIGAPSSNIDSRLQSDSLRSLRHVPALAAVLNTHPEAAQKLALELDNQFQKIASAIKKNAQPLSDTLDDQIATAKIEQSKHFAMAATAKSLEKSRIIYDLRYQKKINLEQISHQFRQNFKAHLKQEADQLLRRALELRERSQKIKDFLGNSPALWDLEESQWQEIDWNGFDEMAKVLRQFPALVDLARRLGRRWSSSQESFGPPQIEIVQEEHLEAYGKSALQGYIEGRDLETVNSHEIALLADPRTEILFLERFADARLSCRLYHSQEPVQSSSGRRHVVRNNTKLNQDQGPVILCLDTSGSMAGARENCAKALCLALIQTIAETQRQAYLIAFSTEIKVLDLSNPSKALHELGNFLNGSFHGGTDLRPALAETERLLLDERWRNADILVVSDFKVPKLLIKKAAMVRTVRETCQSRLHGLSIGSEVLSDDLHLFDSRWHFALGRHDEFLGISPTQFHENI